MRGRGTGGDGKEMDGRCCHSGGAASKTWAIEATTLYITVEIAAARHTHASRSFQAGLNMETRSVLGAASVASTRKCTPAGKRWAEVEE